MVEISRDQSEKPKMKKTLLTTTAIVVLAGGAYAQDLTLSGFLEFEAIYGDNYDLDGVEFTISGDGGSGGIDDLDFGVDGRLNFDYSNSTKSGLEYGVHFELDLYQSDGVRYNPDSDYYSVNGFGDEDRLIGDSVAFNDGYVFINSALGNVKLGDAGAAGAASNQLHVPYLVNALERDQYPTAELELIKYQNSFVGIDFAASVDDDANWNLGIGYAASVGVLDVALGLSAGEDTLAGSIGAAAGGLSFGVNYAVEEAGSTTEYIATGVGYAMGALTIGTGVETEIRHGDIHFMKHDNPTGQEYETNYFIGASYELADGLLLSAGVANLDSDNTYNWSTYHLRSGRGIDVNRASVLGNEQRTWTAGASVKVSF